MKFKDEIKLYKSMIDENLKKVYESGPVILRSQSTIFLKEEKE